MDVGDNMFKKEKKKNSNVRWIITISLLAFAVSFVFSFASTSILNDVNMIMGIIVLLVFIFIGIMFDMIGVAVTSADIGPLNAMSARKIKGADIAVLMIKNSAKVASVCNDVVGDICGIISGTAAATLSVLIANALNSSLLLVSLIVTAITASLTIGGKAIFKEIAIRNSTSILAAFAKIVSLFYKVKK